MLRVVGTPFVGYVSLTNAAPSAAIPIYVIAGSGTAYVLKASERIVLASLQVSSNDSATDLVQVTDQATTPKILASVYVTAAQPPSNLTYVLGTVLGAFGLNLKANSTAITSTKTVEVSISGIIAVQ